MTLAKKSEFAVPGLFDRIFNSDLMDWNLSNFSGPNSTLPAVNVRETDDDFILEVAAPGMNKKDFRISYQNNLLTISSEKEEKTEDKNNGYSRREFSYQSFQRSFTVPGNEVDSDKISAS